MAAKRLSKSNVNWVEVFKTTSEKELPVMRTFKARQDGFVGRVNKSSPELKTIDFAAYKSKVSNPALIDMFEKEYKAVQIPYPKDVHNVTARVDEKQKADEIGDEHLRRIYQKYIDTATQYVEEAEKIPEQGLAKDAFKRYFPGLNKDFDLRDRGGMAHVDNLRYSHYSSYPLHCYNFGAQIKEGLEWYFLTGRYAWIHDELKAKKVEQPKKEEIPAGPEAEEKK